MESIASSMNLRSTALPTRWLLWMVLIMVGVVALGVASNGPTFAQSEGTPATPDKTEPNDPPSDSGTADPGTANPGTAKPGAKKSGAGAVDPDALKGTSAADLSFGASGGLPVGERLLYRAYVDKAGVTAQVGTCEFTVTANDRGEPVLTAVAAGKKLGYTLDATMQTTLDRTTLRPKRHTYVQGGSELRQKKLVFSQAGAIYWKMKHCRDERCQDPDHMVEGFSWVPWREGKKHHCDERNCREPEHLRWRQRGSHTFDRVYFDMLSAIYVARHFDFEADTPPTIAVLNDRDRWVVELIVLSRGPVEIEAGTFEAVEVRLQPKATDKGRVPEEFRGLFGMHGAIRLWLDRSTRQPLKVEGVVPLGPFNLNARVELVERDSIDIAERDRASAGASEGK